MLEVIVTNEFTHMNAGSERPPFKVLRPPERSRAMVIARYTKRQKSAPALPGQTTEPTDMLWKAVRLGGLSAACAFAFFFISERNVFIRTGETLGSLPSDSIQRVQFHGALGEASATEPQHSVLPPPLAERKIVSAAPDPPVFAVPNDPSLEVTEFNLSVAPQFQDLGKVQLRLSGVNPSAHTYDITVRTRRREFYRQDVKLDEQIPLERDSTNGPELVVGAIEPNRVYGYLSEPMHRGHRRHHRRK